MLIFSVYLRKAFFFACGGHKTKFQSTLYYSFLFFKLSISIFSRNFSLPRQDFSLPGRNFSLPHRYVSTPDGNFHFGLPFTDLSLPFTDLSLPFIDSVWVYPFENRELCLHPSSIQWRSLPFLLAKKICVNHLIITQTQSFMAMLINCVQ